MADNPQLPDFAAIGDNHSRIAIAHEQLSREMQHMANLPPIEVNQMMQMLRNVAEGLVTLGERMEDRFTRMDVHLQVKLV